MISHALTGRGFRVAAMRGDQIWLEFDDLATVPDGLREFLKGWSEAWARPPGRLFRLWVGQRDYLALLYGATESQASARLLEGYLGLLDGYLLVRADENHRWLGCANRARLIFRPSYASTEGPRLLGLVEDRRRASPDRSDESSGR